MKPSLFRAAVMAAPGAFGEPLREARKRRHFAAMLFFLVVLTALGWCVWHFGIRDPREMLASLRDAAGFRELALLGLIYAVALAIPFVPGMELGLLIMLMFGKAGVLVAYAATLAGLSMAFVAGRYLPRGALRPALNRGVPALQRIDMADTMPAICASSRWLRWLPPRLAARLVRHRYLGLAVCLNLPGNAIVGGGGGIALLCGWCRQYSARRFLATIAVATAPVPLLVGALDAAQ